MDLVVERVSKRYPGPVWGLRDLNLQVEPGILGLVGPNGAGKTTLMRILATVNRPTSGRVTWNGVDITRSPDGLRAVLGYLPQDLCLYPNLSAVEFLEYLAALKGLDSRAARRRIDELVQLFGLAEVRRRPLGTLSGGMRQRVGIAQALLNDPRLLIVDEPTAGLDPAERVRFRSLLADLAGERIVILSTHIVADVESVATEMAILHHGRLLGHCSPETLLRSVEGRVWEWVIPSDELAVIRAQYTVTGAVRRSDGIHVRVVSPADQVHGARPLAPSLEDAYLCWIAERGEEGAA
jgi:ABC-type multidrug transport system ATPase subunit